MASDHVNTCEEKRFFNKQALIRNRFFQQVLSELQNIGVPFDDLIINKFNFDQLLVSTIDKLKSTAIEKCLEDSRVTGFSGIELGGKFPRNPGIIKFLCHSLIPRLSLEPF